MILPNPIIYINGYSVYANVIYNIEPLDIEETSKITKVSFYMPPNHNDYESVFMKMYSIDEKEYEILYELLDEDVKILGINKDESIKHLEEMQNKVEYYSKLSSDYSLTLCCAISYEESEKGE